MRHYSRIPVLLLIVGLLASLWTAARRVAVERAGRTVELTIDLDQFRGLALSVGAPLPEVLDSLKRAGVTSVAVGEQQLGELETDGLAQVHHSAPGLPPGVTEVRIDDPGLYRQVSEILRLKLRAASVLASGGGTVALLLERALERPNAPSRGVLLHGPGSQELIVPAGWSSVRLLPIGLPAEDVAVVRASGMGLVARVANFTAADEPAIREVAHRLRQAGAHTVVFSGEEILGNRAHLKQTAAALDAEGLRYGSVEFGKQMGDDVLSKALQARIVRVHSIQLAEMTKLDVDEAIDRFVKAAEERNIRLLYLRMIPHVSDNPYQDNLDYVRAVAGQLRQRGLRLGIAEPFNRVYPENSRSPLGLLAPPAPEAGRGGFLARLLARLVPALSALAVAGAAVLLLAGLVSIPAATQSRLALLGGLAAGAVVLGGGDLGRKLVALAGAMLFPTLAFVWFPVAADDEVMRESGDEVTDDGALSGPLTSSHHHIITSSPHHPYRQFAAISLVSLMGALTVVGLLSERPFMVKVAAFMGIKAAHFLPLLVVGLLYAAGALGGPRPWPELRRRARQRLGLLLGERLQLWHLVVGIAALVVVGLLLARTGNDPGVGVSSTEMSLRNWLDRYLVRPRTKEFLIGHPLLLAALVLAPRVRRPSLLIPLALLGAIGQVSMVNSFCHLHTPLLLTVARVFNGLWLGVLIGLLLTWLTGRWLAPVVGCSGSVRRSGVQGSGFRGTTTGPSLPEPERLNARPGTREAGGARPGRSRLR